MYLTHLRIVLTTFLMKIFRFAMPSFTDKNAQMAEFLKYIQNTSDLQTVYQNVQKDSLNALNSTGISSNFALVADNSMDQS